MSWLMSNNYNESDIWRHNTDPYHLRFLSREEYSTVYAKEIVSLWNWTPQKLLEAKGVAGPSCSEG